MSSRSILCPTAVVVSAALGGLSCSESKPDNDGQAVGVGTSTPTMSAAPTQEAPVEAVPPATMTASAEPTPAETSAEPTVMEAPMMETAEPDPVPAPVLAGAGGTANEEGGGGVGGTTVDGLGGAGGAGAGAGGDTGDEMVPIIVGDDKCDVAVYDPANPPQALNVSGSLGTHDPTVIEQDGVFYLFNTGRGLPGKTSTDLRSWNNASAAFSSATTSWVSQEVPAARDLWAPDLSYFNGQYHIYYSASSFGSNESCMGHATRDSMASGSWTDHGPVVCSETNNQYNAIDPNIFIDIDDKVWMFFGSHWDGIKAVELDSTGMSTVGEIQDIAARPRSPRAIEAPVVVRRCGYYYLFVSFDQCCNNWNGGVPYNIRVGRAVNVLGPYVDKDGVEMYPDGGGTLLLGPSGPYQALGHNAVIFNGDKAYNIYHAYNPSSTLRVAELAWDEDGWPISGGP